MSDKTEVLSFDIDKYNSRECQVHNHGFYLGEQSKQAEVGELQNKYDAMYRAFTVADDCRKEWHSFYVDIRKREDELQKRIDQVVHILTYTNRASTPLCNELREILKGEEAKWKSQKFFQRITNELI